MTALTGPRTVHTDHGTFHFPATGVSLAFAAMAARAAGGGRRPRNTDTCGRGCDCLALAADGLALAA